VDPVVKVVSEWKVVAFLLNADVIGEQVMIGPYNNADGAHLSLRDVVVRDILTQGAAKDEGDHQSGHEFSPLDSFERLKRAYSNEEMDLNRNMDLSSRSDRRADLSWEQARDGLLYIARPNLPMSEDRIKLPVIGHVVKSLEHYDPASGLLRTIRRQDLARWNVSRYDIDAIAEHNMALLLCGRFFRMREDESVRYATFESPAAPSSASFCLCNYFRWLMKSTFGFPLYVALPSRNTLRIFPESSVSTIELMRNELIEDYCSNSYPITTEVLEITESGIQVYKDLMVWH
jgi:hypothetical protein